MRSRIGPASAGAGGAGWEQAAAPRSTAAATAGSLTKLLRQGDVLLSLELDRDVREVGARSRVGLEIRLARLPGQAGRPDADRLFDLHDRLERVVRREIHALPVDQLDVADFLADLHGIEVGNLVLVV